MVRIIVIVIMIIMKIVLVLVIKSNNLYSSGLPCNQRQKWKLQGARGSLKSLIFDFDFLRP